MTGIDDVYAEVDTSALPVVRVQVVGPLTEEGFRTYLANLLRALQLRKRVVIRMHAGALSAYPPRYVRKSVSWMKEHKAVLSEHIVAIGIVMESPVVRIATQAMVWAARPSFPMVVMPTREEADNWLSRRFDEDGA